MTFLWLSSFFFLVRTDLSCSMAGWYYKSILHVCVTRFMIILRTLQFKQESTEAPWSPDRLCPEQMTQKWRFALGIIKKKSDWAHAQTCRFSWMAEESLNKHKGVNSKKTHPSQKDKDVWASVQAKLKQDTRAHSFQYLNRLQIRTTRDTSRYFNTINTCVSVHTTTKETTSIATATKKHGWMLPWSQHGNMFITKSTMYNWYGLVPTAVSVHQLPNCPHFHYGRPRLMIGKWCRGTSFPENGSIQIGAGSTTSHTTWDFVAHCFFLYFKSRIRTRSPKLHLSSGSWAK